MTMRVNRRKLIAAVSSVIALIVLVGGLILLTRGKTVVKPTAEGHIQRPVRKPRKGPLRSPFTGERIARLGPELIFKIDNVEQARPPTGLTKADIVYLLP